MSTNARIIYDGINTKLDLDKFVETNTKENLFLEFKKKENNNNPDLGEPDKKNFSEALSQFANSDGGVLVFGVETQKPNDHAKKLFPVQNPEEFLSRLLKFLPEAVQPSVDGVEGKVVRHDNNSGYVIFIIPVSFRTPHRAMVKSREYYKRGQSGKYRLEHFDLEDMFGRRQKPYISLEVKSTQVSKQILVNELDSSQGDSKFLGTINYELFINNIGKYIAKNTILILSFPGETLLKANIIPHSLSGGFVSSIAPLNFGKQVFQFNLIKSLFYPTLQTIVAEIEISPSLLGLSSLDNIKINWEAYAEDMQNLQGEIVLDFKKLISTT